MMDAEIRIVIVS